MNRQPLTEPQQETLDFIARFIRENGYPPSLRKIQQELKLKSIAPVQNRLYLLRDKGYITWEEGHSRTIRLVGSLTFDELRQRAIAALEEALAQPGDAPTAVQLLEELRAIA